MSERVRLPFESFSDDELGAALKSASPALFPAAPELTGSVVRRLEVAGDRSARRAPRFGLLAAAAMLALLLVGPFFFSPALREAAAAFFGVGGVEIEVTERPTDAPLVAPDLGAQSDLTAIQAEVNFDIRVPEVLGAPDRVYLDRSTGADVVSLVYEPRGDLPEAKETGVGLLIMEFEGSVPGAFIKKTAGVDSRLRLVDLDGRTAYWVSGAPHPILYRDADGEVRESTARLAANTLLFSSGGLTIRIEGDIPLGRALAIARSL